MIDCHFCVNNKTYEKSLGRVCCMGLGRAHAVHIQYHLGIEQERFRILESIGSSVQLIN